MWVFRLKTWVLNCAYLCLGCLCSKPVLLHSSHQLEPSYHWTSGSVIIQVNFLLWLIHYKYYHLIWTVSSCCLFILFPALDAVKGHTLNFVLQIINTLFVFIYNQRCQYWMAQSSSAQTTSGTQGYERWAKKRYKWRGRLENRRWNTNWIDVKLLEILNSI